MEFPPWGWVHVNGYIWPPRVSPSGVDGIGVVGSASSGSGIGVVARPVRRVRILCPEVGVGVKIQILRDCFPYLSHARVDVRTGTEVKILLDALSHFPASFISLKINCYEGGKVGCTCLAKALCARISLVELSIYGVDFFLSEKRAGEKALSRMSGGRSCVEKLVLSSRRLDDNQKFHSDDDAFDVLGVFENPFVRSLKNGVRVRLVKKRATNISRQIGHLVHKLGMLRMFVFDGADEESYLIDFNRIGMSLQQRSGSSGSSHTLRSLWLKGITVDLIGTTLQLFPNLESLRVEECKLLHYNRIDTGFVPHPPMTDLAMTQNSSVFNDFPLAFQCFPNLQRLKLKKNAILSVSVETNFPRNESVSHLDVSDNSVKGEGFFKLLARNMALKTLIVESNPIDFSSVGEFFESTALTELNVSKTKCGLVGLLIILTSFPELKTLCVSRAQVLFEEGDELPHAPTLRSLDICSNKLGEKGFVQVLTKLPGLERLCASQCDVKISEELFSTEVTEPLRLREVGLSLNYITSDGLASLLVAAPECKYLDLLSNRITPPRFSLPYHPSLRVILLALNRLTAEDLPHMFRHLLRLRIVMVGSSKDEVATLHYPILLHKLFEDHA